MSTIARSISELADNAHDAIEFAAKNPFVSVEDEGDGCATFTFDDGSALYVGNQIFFEVDHD